MIVIQNSRLRTILKYVIPFLLIPIIAILGTLVFDEKKHIFVSLFVVVLSLILFIAGFEKKSIGTRRMVIVSVMVALSVAGRFIPFFKPITAITIITAIYLGSESGFLVGALSAFLSNFYFGQGPWTPFQMLAWGLIGFIAGLLGDVLQKHRIPLLLYGAISGVVFSFIMDVWSVLSYSNSFDFELYKTAIITAAPYTALYTVSNVIFLLLIAKPFGDKLIRIKIKYGI